MTASTGCDSIVTLDLDIIPTKFESLSAEFCDGGTFQVGNSVYDATGIYMDTLTASTGCDSIVTLDLVVNQNFFKLLNVKICENDFWTVGDNQYNETGAYKDTLTSINGCDSIIFLALQVTDVLRTNISETICLGENYELGGNFYNQPGQYIDTLSSGSGCDSIVTLDLFVIDIQPTINNRTICEGDSIFLENAYQTVGGVYTDNFSTGTSCDSIIYTYLTVIDEFTIYEEEIICEGDSIFLGGAYQFFPGLFTDSLTSVAGCDSIVITELFVDPATTLFVEGCLLYTSPSPRDATLSRMPSSA